MTKLVQVPKEKLRAKRALVVERMAGDGVEKIEATAQYDLRAPLAVRPKTPPTSPAALYLSSLAEGASRTTMAAALKKVAGLLARAMVLKSADILTFPWHEIDVTLVAGLRSHLQETSAPKSANNYLIALRQVLKASAQLGLMTYEKMYGLVAAAKKVNGYRVPPGRALSREDVEALFGQCDRSTGIGKRDAAMLVLFFGCGLRKIEIWRATLDELTFAPRDKTAPLVVEGKKRKQRTVYLSANALEIMKDWLRFRGNDPGPLILTCDEGKKPRGLSMTAIYARIVALGQRAGIAHVSPHDLRRTYITDLLESGADAIKVSKMVGHEDVQTTSGYDRRPEEGRKEVQEQFHADRFEKMTGETPKSAKKQMEAQAKKGTKKR